MDSMSAELRSPRSETASITPSTTISGSLEAIIERVRSRDASLKGLVNRKDRRVLDVGHLHVGDGTCKVLSAHRAVGNGHCLIQGKVAVWKHRHGDVLALCGINAAVRESEKLDFENISSRHIINGKLAFRIGGRAI